jgi:small-conductance mechanosensitive channel
MISVIITSVIIQNKKHKMNIINNLLNLEFAGNSGEKYLLALGIFLGLLIIFKFIKLIIINKLEKIAKKTTTKIDDTMVKIIKEVKPSIYFFLSLFLALKYLSFPIEVNKILNAGLILIIVYQLSKSAQIFINLISKRIINKNKEENKETNKYVVKNIGLIAKILIWTFAILIILANWVVNITSIIAGLGIGGVAIAFALQNILEDIFSSFSIFIDKPFKVGDFILVGSDSGVVEKIGIKTTRIKTLSGEELVVSNKELTTARVHNYKKMEQRRVAFSLGLCYETSLEKLKKVPKIIEETITQIDSTKFSRVHFKNYGDFSLNFEIVYFINSSDYDLYMDIQQEINFKIKEEFAKNEIEFAYPTQTVLLQK